MKNSFKIFIQLAVILVLGGGAILLALELMDNLYNYRSPLSENPPIPGQSFGEPIGERVVFVLIDALRYDTSLDVEVMPVLNQLRNQGASAKMHSQPPSYSSPGYGSLLTGAWPYLSDAPAFNLDYENIYPLTQDNIFSSAKRHGKTTAVSGYYWFEKLIPADALDIGYFTPDEDQVADRLVVDAAIPWLQSGEYKLILIHLDQIDYAGHYEGGPQNVGWQQAATRVDNLLAEIVSELDLTKDVLVICSDHGQIDQGGHGGQDEITLIEPFVMVGKGIRSGEYDDILMVDVAPTLAALSGINLPASTQGRVLEEMIFMPATTRLELKSETARQQSQLLAAYASAIGAELPLEATDANPNITVQQYQNALEGIQKTRLNRERTIRIAIAAVILLVLIITIWKRKPKGLLNGVLAAILFSVIFHFGYITFGQKIYSYSTVVSPTQLILINAIFSLVSLSVVWLLFTFQTWVSLDLKQNIIKALGLAIVIMLFTTIPLIGHILWNGLFATWILPDLFLHYLALLSLIQIFIIGVGVLLFVLTTGIILIDRKRKPA
ncbi:MAG TPA: alkaline phosphatase family protein [Anaerolineaceae bacterium]|nr:alkaline phosphatase family protein [Anaerolineaceae bacterium]